MFYSSCRVRWPISGHSLKNLLVQYGRMTSIDRTLPISRHTAGELVKARMSSSTASTNLALSADQSPESGARSHPKTNGKIRKEEENDSGTTSISLSETRILILSQG